jgi:hypothetical protein
MCSAYILTNAKCNIVYALNKSCFMISFPSHGQVVCVIFVIQMLDSLIDSTSKISAIQVVMIFVYVEKLSLMMESKKY